MILDLEDNMCFACSPKNPIGLKLRFRREGDVVRAGFVVRPEHQGWPGCLHGGLVATLCDEAMAQWLWLREIEAYTGELTVRFKKNVPVGTPVEVVAELAARRGRLVLLTAAVLLPGGVVAATASGKFLMGNSGPAALSDGENTDGGESGGSRKGLEAPGHAPEE